MSSMSSSMSSSFQMSGLRPHGRPASSDGPPSHEPDEDWNRGGGQSRLLLLGAGNKKHDRHQHTLFEPTTSSESGDVQDHNSSSSAESSARRTTHFGHELPLVDGQRCHQRGQHASVQDSDLGERDSSLRPGSRSKSVARDADTDAEADADTDIDADDYQEHHHINRDLAETMDLLRPQQLVTSRSASPLLQKNDEDRGRTRYNHSRTPSASPPPPSSRRSTMRSRSPNAHVRMAARDKYTYAAIFLVISLISFTAQTELAAYVQTDLGWNKAYCMLYLTHGSWALLWPAQLLILRMRQRQVPWHVFWRRHVSLLRSTAHMVAGQTLEPSRAMLRTNPLAYLIRTTAFITSALTVAGLSWYLAVDMTSPSDLTAIYNCSAFFAYAFSVPLLKEKLRLDKSFAVAIAVIGVLVVAYGDTKPLAVGEDALGATAAGAAGNRSLGNLIIGFGSVLYGLYEVLYKRWACPPDGVSAGRGMVFANTFGSCIGLFTLTVLWLPLPLLHLLGWERFELPTGEAAVYLGLSVVMNATFAGSFLVLISLTSPVLSSVAGLLTIFIVAAVDWLRTGEPMSPAALLGGLMIVLAFLMLSWSTWWEMTELDAAGDGKHVEAEYESSESEAGGVD